MDTTLEHLDGNPVGYYGESFHGKERADKRDRSPNLHNRTGLSPKMQLGPKPQPGYLCSVCATLRRNLVWRTSP